MKFVFVVVLSYASVANVKSHPDPYQCEKFDSMWAIGSKGITITPLKSISFLLSYLGFLMALLESVVNSECAHNSVLGDAI